MITSILGLSMGLFLFSIAYACSINVILCPYVFDYFWLCTRHFLYNIIYRNNTKSEVFCFFFNTEYIHLLLPGALILEV